MDDDTLYGAFDAKLEGSFGKAYDPVPFLGGVAIGALAVKAKGKRMFIFGSAAHLFPVTHPNYHQFNQLHNDRSVSTGTQPLSYAFGARASRRTDVQIEENIQSLPVNGQLVLKYEFTRETSFIFNSSNCIRSDLNNPGGYCSFIASNRELYLEALYAKSHSSAKGIFKKPKYVYVAVKAIFAANGAYLEQVNNSKFQEASVELGVQRVAQAGFRFNVNQSQNLNAQFSINNSEGYTIGVVWYKVRLPKVEERANPRAATVDSRFIGTRTLNVRPGNSNDEDDDDTDDDHDEDGNKVPSEGFIKPVHVKKKPE